MTDHDTIFEIYGSKSFLKIKRDSFPIGKVHFAFVNMDENKKEIESMDCYLDMGIAGVFAMNILLGYVSKDAEKERAKGDKYPKPVWTSPMGGISESKARERHLRSDGKAISRSFNFAPGSSMMYVFTAIQKPGHTDDRGLIVPESGAKAEITIRVPVMDDTTLKSMAYRLNNEILSYNMMETMIWYKDETEKKMLDEKRVLTEEIAKKRRQAGSLVCETEKTNKSGTKEVVNRQETSKHTEKPDVVIYRAKSITGVKEYSNGFALKAILDDNREIVVKFTDESIKTMPAERWSCFRQRTSTGSVKFRFEGKQVQRQDGQVLLEYVSGF